MPSGYERSDDYAGPKPRRFGLAIALIVAALCGLAALAPFARLAALILP